MESRRDAVRTTAGAVRVRSFRDEDYAHLASIGTASFPDSPVSEAEIRHNDGAWDHGRYWLVRFVAEEPSGEVVGTGRMSHMAYEFHPQKYLMFLTVHPDRRRRGVGSILFDHVLTELNARSATAVRTWVQKETMTDSVEFLSHRGFREVQRGWESRLDVAGFDAARFAGAEERAVGQGITLTTLAAARERDPEALRRIYGMINAILPDAPAVDQITPVTYEQWLGFDVETPKALPDAFFLAKDGARYVGLSFLQRRLEQPEVLQQELTGVLREYRGKGIAMALKLQTVKYARAHGYREIRTGNDTRNRPMLRINEAMGFVKQPAAITFEKALPGKDSLNPAVE